MKKHKRYDFRPLFVTKNVNLRFSGFGLIKWSWIQSSKWNHPQFGGRASQTYIGYDFWPFLLPKIVFFVFSFFVICNIEYFRDNDIKLSYIPFGNRSSENLIFKWIDSRKNLIIKNKGRTAPKIMINPIFFQNCITKILSNEMRFSDERFPNGIQFHLIFLSRNSKIFNIKNYKKAENKKYSFWLQKGVKNHIRYVFVIRDPQIVGSFICYFWLMTILSSQNVKNVKYRFWLQKGIKNHIRYDFLIRDPQIMGSFICYFWLMTILSSQNVKNVKYRFWLQKGVKNSIWQIFLIRDPQIVGGFICYFWLKIIFDER